MTAPTPTIVRTADDLRGLVGHELPPSPWVRVTQGRIDAFADVADDRHWVHNDPELATRGPFGRPIGHAHLTLALVPSFFRRMLVFEDGAACMFYGYNRVRFPMPVPSEGRIRMQGSLAAAESAGGATQLTIACVVEVEGEERPACVAEALWRHYAIATPQ